MEINIHALEGARTPDLRISLSVLTYMYDVLTGCATGADILRAISGGYYIYIDISISIKLRNTKLSQSKNHNRFLCFQKLSSTDNHNRYKHSYSKGGSNS